VLVPPVYDRCPFIIGTDALKKAFAVFAVFVGQHHEHESNTVAIHPIAFASRQKTPAEARYHPFISELAAPAANARSLDRVSRTHS
jgi:hypothetical protein